MPHRHPFFTIVSIYINREGKKLSSGDTSRKHFCILYLAESRSPLLNIISVCKYASTVKKMPLNKEVRGSVIYTKKKNIFSFHELIRASPFISYNPNTHKDSKHFCLFPLLLNDDSIAHPKMFSFRGSKTLKTRFLPLVRGRCFQQKGTRTIKLHLFPMN